SLSVLQTAKKLSPSQITKSGIMVGMGEKESEVIEVMKNARDNQVDIFTIGQYLPPTARHYPLQEFIHPRTFETYQKKGEEMGLLVLSGPWIRSSYQAEKVYHQATAK
ncbi:MAG: lipoyl synthase, partial [Caldiserica bacterium]|nr:lipoyl synthase [Caldisericota bacterium]